jgi:hypothetical protein
MATSSACSQYAATTPWRADAAAEHLGEAPSGDDAELRGEVLDEPRHDVAEHHDPDEQVAVLGARRHVARDVARVEVGHPRHERGADQPREARDRGPRRGVGRGGARVDGVAIGGAWPDVEPGGRVGLDRGRVAAASVDFGIPKYYMDFGEPKPGSRVDCHPDAGNRPRC